MPKTSQFKDLVLLQKLQEVQDSLQQQTIAQVPTTLPLPLEMRTPLLPLPSYDAHQGSTWQELFTVLPQADARQAPFAIIPQGNGGYTPFPSVAQGNMPPVPFPQMWQRDLQRAAPGASLAGMGQGNSSLAMASSEQDTLMLSPGANKAQVWRGVALFFSALLVVALFLVIWHNTTPTSASPTVTQQSYSGASTSQNGTSTTSSTSSGTIQVYIIGAVLHPGVYRLAADARVYQLVQMAGGALPNADLVSLNLAARLSDGQEIYILSVGETPPNGYSNNPSGPSSPSSPSVPGSGTSTPTLAPGQLVNINTASETEMRQLLHISSVTAKKIIAYRVQYGPYTSVDQLLQVVSKTIYNRIKNMVTV